MTKKLKRSYKEKHKKSVALKQIFARFFFGTNTKQVLLGSVGFPAFPAFPPCGCLRRLLLLLGFPAQLPACPESPGPPLTLSPSISAVSFRGTADSSALFTLFTLLWHVLCFISVKIFQRCQHFLRSCFCRFYFIFFCLFSAFPRSG